MNTRSRAPRRVLATLLCACATGWAEEAPYHAEDPARWGTPRRVLPPEYPKAAIDKGHTGHVDMEGSVTPFTTFKVDRYVPDSEASNVFVEPLKEAIKHWTFYAPVGRDCQPTLERSVVRVWFELDGGKPKISVSTRKLEPGKDPKVLKPLKRIEPRYPESMLREGLQAYVYARMQVTPAGEVASVTAVAYPTTYDRRAFVRETENTLKTWKYPAAEGADRIVCMEVIYRMY